MRRGYAVGVAIAAAIAVAPVPGQGRDAAASTGGEGSAGQQSPLLVHGDQIPPGADRRVAESEMRSFAPADRRLSERRLAGAWCGTERSNDDNTHAATSSSHAIKVVYASPADYPDRFGYFADLIQNDVRAASQAFQDASQGTRIPRFDLGTACGPDYVDIASVRLRNADYYVHGSGGAQLSIEERSDRISQDVAGALGGMSGVYNTLIYADGLYANDQITGFGFRMADDHKGATNQHNKGGLAAIVLGASTASNTEPGFGPADSRISSVLHELGHTLGAVQASAPHSTGGGHCTDGADILCYADGGPRGQPGNIVSRCAATDPMPIDCGNDDYFAVNPPAGSYLATHWNVYDSDFLCPPSSCTFGGGNRAPVADVVLRDAAGSPIGDAQAATPVVLDGSSSTDPDGSVATWTWDLGDDGSVEGTGAQFATSFPAQGMMPVRLRITDASGLPDSTTRTFVVGPAPSAGRGTSPGTSGAGANKDDGAIDVFEDPRSILRRRLRQARTSAEKRLRQIGVPGLMRGKTLTVRYRSPEPGDITVSLALRDLPVVVATRYARSEVVTSIRLRVAKGGRNVLRNRKPSELKLQLDFQPLDDGYGRQPR